MGYIGTRGGWLFLATLVACVGASSCKKGKDYVADAAAADGIFNGASSFIAHRTFPAGASSSYLTVLESEAADDTVLTNSVGTFAVDNVTIR